MILCLGESRGRGRAPVRASLSASSVERDANQITGSHGRGRIRESEVNCDDDEGDRPASAYRRAPLSFARAAALRRFRFAMILFCIAMTVTLYSSAVSEWAACEGEIATGRAKPHRDAMEEPDPHIAAASQAPEKPKSADADSAQIEPAGRFRFEAASGRARANSIILEGEAAAP